MLTFIASFVESKISASSKFIHRDDLSEKKSLSKPSLKEPLLKVKDQEEKEPKPSSRSRGLNEKGTLRVKLKMTKAEAARLLSKCKDGGVLEFKDVACEIVNLPMDRVTVVSSCSATSSVLDCIRIEC